MKAVKEFYSGKKILLTGDTGFKGSWLAIWLTHLGAKVYGYALAADTDQANFIKCGLEKVIHHVDGDIRDFKKLNAYIQEIKPDICFHLAAQPLVLSSYTDPVYNYETNVMGTINFLEALRNCASVKAAVVITTDKCYQNNEWIWGYRESDAMGGKDPYSASKACAEIVTHSYISSFFSDKDACKIATVRAGNVIGGGDWAEHRIIPDFFRAMVSGEELTLRNPDATRPWQHVLEPLRGYLLIGSLLAGDNGLKYTGAWNFGPAEENHVSVGTLVKNLARLNHNKVKYSIVKNANQPHEATLLKLDISKASFLLHWRPVLTLEQTLAFTTEGYEVEVGNSKDLLKERIKQIEKYSELVESSIPKI